MSALALATCLALGAQAQDEGPALVRRQILELPEPVAAWRVLDLDGDGRAELLTVARGGRVAVRRAGGDGRFPRAVEGGLVLAEPERSLLALRPPSGGGALELLVVDPAGTRVFALRPDGFGPEGRLLARGARNVLRPGRPVFAPLARDVNEDGLCDLVVPDGRGVDLWIARRGTGEEGVETLERAARLPLELSHSQSAGARLLSDALSERIVVPSLATEDVDGDGREDLVVEEGSRRAWHLQDESGGFPERPSVELDLALFRDTTPQASLAPGRTLVLGDEAQISSADLDGDGVPDHVIAHRRKVWVFHGGEDGPQFTRPSAILKTAEDVTALALVELDADGRPDLLIVKLVVPSLGALVVGMLRELDVEITALGYANAGAEGFARVPSLRSTLVLRLPPLARILSGPEELYRRVEEAERKFRAAAFADLDGDGTDDVAMLDEGGRAVEVWRSDPAREREDASPGAWIRRLLFEQEDPVFDVDRVIELLGTWAERRTSRLTGARPRDAAAALGEEVGLPVAALLPADVDGDGREELVVGYEGADGRLAIEILGLD